MRGRSKGKPVLFLVMLLASVIFLAWPSGGYAAHDLGQNCYNCHNIEMGQVWTGSYSVWSGLPIGMSSYSRPITCEICHTDYGDRFKATSASHHPVAVIAGASMNSSYDNGVQVRCRDCHNADSVSLTPNLTPDLAPTDYLSTAGNTATDGYPNHDVLLPNNQVVPGDNAHLLSMLLSGGQRTVNGSSVYNKVPSANPSADYAFCLACHDGSANTGRAVNVKQDYIDRGHFFWETGGGITAGDRIPCSDCHASHNSPTNARLIEPDNTTWTGARPSGLAFANPYAPTNAEYRALCIFCHEDYNPTNTVNTAKRVRGVAPAPRLYGVPGHAGTDTVSCRQCHNPHKTPGGGPDCLTCHTSGGGAGARVDYIDSLFKGVGSDNSANQPASVGPLTWSQHGGFVSVGGAARFIYASPYNTKGTNDCFKCHGDRHNNRYSLVDADNTDSYAYNPSLGMRDNTASGIANANAFCLTCHDGIGAAADIQIGNQVPSNVAANYATSGHGRSQASGAYTVSLNNPAYLKCTDCHEVHGSNHAKLLPAKKNEAAANFTIPSNFPEKTFRSGASTLLSRDLDFTDYSSPASGKGFGTAGDPGNQRAPSGASTGLCDACHRFAGRANRGTDNVTNRAHTHEGNVGDTNQNSPSQMTFTKDCVECHDTHGTTNLEMVNATINGNAVTFAARTGANSFDPVESGAAPNVNSVCVVCHQNPTENPALNVAHNFRTSTVNPDHNEDTNCTTCHQHGNATNAAKFGFPQGKCDGCHGNNAGSDWPDNTLVSAVYPDRAGAHAKHVTAIANARGITGNATCNTCHPGNPPPGHESDATTGASQAEVTRMDNNADGIANWWRFAEGANASIGTPVYFKNITGANDNAALFNSASKKNCSGVTCHGGSDTPNWYTGERYDTTPPVWSGGVSGVAATDLAQGGAVSVSWNTATDAGHPPVQYTLYWSDNAASVFTTPTGTMDNLATTSATVTGLANGTPFYFGVRARDNASPANATTNTDTASATPTALPSQSRAVNWKLKKSTGVPVYTGQSTNLGATCGTSVAIIAAGASGTYPVPGRGLLTGGALTCTSFSTSNFVSNSSPAITEEQFVAFYTDNTYTLSTIVTGNAAGSSVGIMSSTASPHTVRVRLAGVTSAGAHTLSSNTVAQTVASITNTAYPLDLSALSVTVPAGGRLAVIFTWQDNNTSGSINDHILMDNVSTVLNGIVSVSETPIDTAPPVFNGGGSGIAVSATGLGDSLQVSWNQAVDALTPPVRYDLYRTTVLAGLWSSPYRTNLGTTSIIDSGLTEGTTYYYGVRAKDSVTPTPNVTTNTDNASGTPISGAPVWSGDVSGIAATDLAQGGAVSVIWNTATDADYPPVQYTLYWSTSASTVFTAGTLMDNVAATSATVTGLTNGMPYYFGVRAKDSASPFNRTTNTDNVSATPTAPPGPSSKVYYLDKPSSATTLWGTTLTNLSTACPGTTTNLAVSTAPGGATWPGTLPSVSAPPAGRGLLSTTRVCGTMSTTNYMGSNTTAWNAAWRLFGGFYTAPYGVATTVTGSATGNNFGFRSASGTENVRILFVAVDNVGNHTMNTGSYVDQLNIPTAMTVYSALSLSGLSVNVPANGRFAVYLYYYDTSTAGSANHQIAYDSYSASITNLITVTETPIDTDPPVFNGGGSGIAVSATGLGDSLQVSWNQAVDALTPPVRYDLYRTTVLAGLWSSPYRTNLGTTSIIDSGLTEGTTYYYGVRAKDGVTPTPNVTTNIDNASGTPRTGDSCNACHTAPPVTGGGAGSHAKHARTDVIADCDKCHPGASGYSNSHQDGVGQLGFAGTAYNAIYGNPTANTLRYNNGAADFYVDSTGYGILTGSVGDNTDNGTCGNTLCHGTATPVWGAAGSVACGTCHGTAGGETPVAPTVTATNSHVDADGAGGTWTAGDCKGCHAGHTQGVEVPLPPTSWSNANLPSTNMRTRLGIDYAGTGAIHLGGAGTAASINAKTTEAEICWGCHDSLATPVSEWGYNTKTTPSGFPVVNIAPTDGDSPGTAFDYGWIYSGSVTSTTKTSDWTTGYWRDQYDPGLRRRIVSMHSGSFDSAGQSSSVAANVDSTGAVSFSTPTLENKSYLRCSYCHDVHGLKKAQGASTLSDPLAKPWLRGTWVGNPYPPDMPPQSAYTYPTTGGPPKTVYASDNNIGGRYSRFQTTAMPRLWGYNGDGVSRAKGGFFIDQNSNNPTANTSMDTYAKVGGLCQLCHGDTVDGMDYYTGSTLWRTIQGNGHNNSTIGGSGAGRVKIFDARRGSTGTPGDYMAQQGRMGQSQPQLSVGWGPELQGAKAANSGYTGQDAVIYITGWYGDTAGRWPDTTTGVSGYTDWYNPPASQVAKPNYHKFTCSKCHTPHASGLPALLVTNCLDARLSTWTAASPANTRVNPLVNMAQNCHRKADTANGQNDGWNRLKSGQDQ